MFPRYMNYQQDIASVAASNNASTFFYFPRAFRVTRYGAVPSVAEPAHATQESKIEFINKLTDGSGTAVLATLTNLSGATPSITLAEGAWVAFAPLSINCELRTHNAVVPTAAQNVADAIPAGTVIQAKNTKAAGTQTSNVSVFIEGTLSS